MNCPICESSNIKLLYPSNIDSCKIESYLISEDLSGKNHDIWQCNQCGHGFVASQEFIQQVINLYQDQPVDNLYLSEKRGRSKSMRSCLNKIYKFIPKATKILDIGCYVGLFLNQARDLGWQIEGVELSKNAINVAKLEFNIDTIQQGKIEQVLPQLENNYPAITMFDVIEHLEKPEIVIQNIYEKLSPQGLLFISTPNVNSIMTRLGYTVLPSHLHYFSRQSLTDILAKHNFKIVYNGYQTRYFTPGYILRRNHTTHKLKLDKLLNSKLFKKFVMPMNFMDQLIIIGQK